MNIIKCFPLHWNNREGGSRGFARDGWGRYGCHQRPIPCLDELPADGGEDSADVGERLAAADEGAQAGDGGAAAARAGSFGEGVHVAGLAAPAALGRGLIHGWRRVHETGREVRLGEDPESGDFRRLRSGTGHSLCRFGCGCTCYGAGFAGHPSGCATVYSLCRFTAGRTCPRPGQCDHSMYRFVDGRQPDGADQGLHTQAVEALILRLGIFRFSHGRRGIGRLGAVDDDVQQMPGNGVLSPLCAASGRRQDDPVAGDDGQALHGQRGLGDGGGEHADAPLALATPAHVRAAHTGVHDMRLGGPGDDQHMLTRRHLQRMRHGDEAGGFGARDDRAGGLARHGWSVLVCEEKQGL